MKYQTFFEHFDERMRNLMVFAPLFGLMQKKLYPKYDLFALGFSVLIFIFEDMVRFEHNCTYENIAKFLQELVLDEYEEMLSDTESMELTITLVREYLRNNGNQHSYSYYDYQSGTEKKISFDLIRYSEESLMSDIQHRRGRLELTEEGLSLLFATKETPSELQIPIKSLFLRQQIQKRIFDGALRTVEELFLAVRTKKARFRTLAEKIRRDALEVHRKNELQQEIEQMHEQLEIEKRTFEELDLLIKQTIEDDYNGVIGEKEKIAKDVVTRIQQRLYLIMSEHESLFVEQSVIQKRMGSALEQLLLDAFSVKLQLDKEVIPVVLTGKVTKETFKQILHPLLPRKQNKHFNPLLAFESQRLTKKRVSSEPDDVSFADDLFVRAQITREKEEQEAHITYLTKLLKMFLLPLQESEKTHLSAVLESDIAAHQSFCPIVIQLHQTGIISLEKGGSGDELAEAISRVTAIHKFPFRGFLLRPNNAVMDIGLYQISDFWIERVG
ncbi:hypothetical protein LLE49_24120 [Alicyclobacillus tolerans]|uniref:hypothetical protein n=1 Tax=Alicyclobacillus tolerans TaxID=90970 RepID=UPI001F2EBC3D|nr:hypothetical protein [Alicyclobacillus tolerans]MCF8567812.1 hypothetical protein [Alicyclobacillus tolerans]